MRNSQTYSYPGKKCQKTERRNKNLRRSEKAGPTLAVANYLQFRHLDPYLSRHDAHREPGQDEGGRPEGRAVQIGDGHEGHEAHPPREAQGSPGQHAGRR